MKILFYLNCVKNGILFLILIFFIYFLFNKKIYSKTFQEIKFSKLKKTIRKLNAYGRKRKPEYILFSDYILSKYCSDINAFTLFEYYLKNNIDSAYYIINNESDLYKSLLQQNKTKNLLLINQREYIFDKLFNYILNSKIIVQSYVILDFQNIVNNVTYLKYLYLNHGITYFKNNFIASELMYLKEDKRNIITSSPYEYNIFINKFNYSSNYIYKAGIARYEKYETIEVDKTEKDCILATFTYRAYNNTLYEHSLYKINLEKLLNKPTLIEFLKYKNIDLIYVPHHNELFLKKKYNQTNFIYAKIGEQNKLTQYIKKCKLLITDFSSISFAFMFQHKPILFYLIDLNDTMNVSEKMCMDPNNKLYFGNAFLKTPSLIKKVKYYIRKGFQIDEKLKFQYDSVFYYKKNITTRIFSIINNIINS